MFKQISAFLDRLFGLVPLSNHQWSTTVGKQVREYTTERSMSRR